MFTKKFNCKNGINLYVDIGYTSKSENSINFEYEGTTLHSLFIIETVFDIFTKVPAKNRFSYHVQTNTLSQMLEVLKTMNKNIPVSNVLQRANVHPKAINNLIKFQESIQTAIAHVKTLIKEGHE